MGSGDTLGIGWKKQTSLWSPWASSVQTSVRTAGEHFSVEAVTPLKMLIALSLWLGMFNTGQPSEPSLEPLTGKNYRQLTHE